MIFCYYCCFPSEQFTILKMLPATNVESKIYGFDYYYFSVLGLYIFFKKEKIPSFWLHWKAESGDTDVTTA